MVDSGKKGLKEATRLPLGLNSKNDTSMKKVNLNPDSIIREDVQCVLALPDGKGYLLGIGCSVYHWSFSSEKSPILPQEKIKLEGRVSDMCFYDEYLLVAEGHRSPESNICIKVFLDYVLFRNLKEARFKTGYFFSDSIYSQLNSFNRVFCLFQNSIYFVGDDKYVYQLKITKNEALINRMGINKQTLHQFRSNSSYIFGIDISSIVMFNLELTSSIHKVELGETLTCLEACEKFIFISRCVEQSYPSRNEIIILKTNLCEMTKVFTKDKESIRHMKYLSRSNQDYLITTTFGYDSVLSIYEIDDLKNKVALVRREESSNPSNFCSWINAMMPIKSSGNVLTFGPIGHIYLHKTRLDLT